jgi:hypothetical protein
VGRGGARGTDELVVVLVGFEEARLEDGARERAQFGAGRNWPLGAALSMTLLIIVTIALLFYVRAANRGAPHG